METMKKMKKMKKMKRWKKLKKMEKNRKKCQKNEKMKKNVEKWKNGTKKNDKKMEKWQKMKKCTARDDTSSSSATALRDGRTPHSYPSITGVTVCQCLQNSRREEKNVSPYRSADGNLCKCIFQYHSVHFKKIQSCGTHGYTSRHPLWTLMFFFEGFTVLEFTSVETRQRSSQLNLYSERMSWRNEGYWTALSSLYQVLDVYVLSLHSLR